MGKEGNPASLAFSKKAKWMFLGKFWSLQMGEKYRNPSQNALNSGLGIIVMCPDLLNFSKLSECITLFNMTCFVFFHWSVMTRYPTCFGFVGFVGFAKTNMIHPTILYNLWHFPSNSPAATHRCFRSTNQIGIWTRGKCQNLHSLETVFGKA